MCGRFAVKETSEELANELDAVLTDSAPTYPNFNVCPTNQVAVCISVNGTRRLGGMRWGFIPTSYASPDSGPLIINARAETVVTKGTFAQSVRTRRCIIPMSGYYEWQVDGQARLPHFTHNTDSSLMAVGGIWQMWGTGSHKQATCAIITVPSADSMSHLHHRMPLIWQNPTGRSGSEKGAVSATLMKPTQDGAQSFPVSDAISSNRSTGAPGRPSSARFVWELIYGECICYRYLNRLVPLIVNSNEWR